MDTRYLLFLLRATLAFAIKVSPEYTGLLYLKRARPVKAISASIIEIASESAKEKYSDF